MLRPTPNFPFTSFPDNPGTSRCLVTLVATASPEPSANEFHITRPMRRYADANQDAARKATSSDGEPPGDQPMTVDARVGQARGFQDEPRWRSRSSPRQQPRPPTTTTAPTCTTATASRPSNRPRSVRWPLRSARPTVPCGYLGCRLTGPAGALARDA